MKYEIRKYYSTFFTIEVEADSEDVAIEKSKSVPLNENELFNNLEDWEDANEVERIEYTESEK